MPKDAGIVYPWWPEKVESSKDVMARVSAGIDALLAEYGDTDEEVLLVGHGASSDAADEYLNLNPDGMLWNCCLSMYDSKNPQANYAKNVSFLPGQMVTNNKLAALDYASDKSLTPPFDVHLPKELENTDQFKLLHIGDTHSASYSYYRKLIPMLKPDVIVHTGDTADEDKVGWDTSAVDAYLMKVKMLADILKEANCPVYWVPGNNDLPEEVAKIAPFFKIVEPDTVVEIEGHTFCLTHSFDQITKKAEYYLYGHGVVGESFEHELTLKGDDGLCLNNMWRIQVITFPEKQIYYIETPD